MTDAVAGRSPRGLSWRGLVADDMPGLTELYQRALACDGGQPFAADEWMLRRWFVDGIEDSLAVFEADRLVGVCAWRYGSSAGERYALIAGQVDPELRRLGIGGRLLDFALDGAAAAPGAVRVETESLCSGADALYRSRGLTCVFAEDIMTSSLADGLPEAATTADVAFTEWSDSVAARFYAAYEAAFRDRPGVPGWSATEWIGWITDDDDFRADWTLLASAAGADVGFVVGGEGGWISQVGVVPAARRHGVASTLIIEALRRMRAEGQTQAVLNVNVNNPGAIAAYRRLGFRCTGSRARYEPARLAAPWHPR
jgi:mycothiol synthase